MCRKEKRNGNNCLLRKSSAMPIKLSELFKKRRQKREEPTRKREFIIEPERIMEKIRYLQGGRKNGQIYSVINTKF